MEFVIALVLFVVLVGAWVVLPAKKTAQASVAHAEPVDGLKLTPTV